ncbi:hypothetical protein ASF90_02565 [Xanthomonas sp. Leaf148]|nr:hypothetical protein ASF90_02565 [Xanthomonas sp. Leaf148]
MRAAGLEVGWPGGPAHERVRETCRSALQLPFLALAALARGLALHIAECWGDFFLVWLRWAGGGAVGWPVPL